MTLDTRRWKGPVRRLIEEHGNGKDSSVSLPGYSAMRSVPTADIREGAMVTIDGRDTPGDGGQGTFRWVPGDQSAEVALDVLHGVYVPPDEDPTGKSGAWVRIHENVFDPNWFGCKGDDSHDDNPHYVDGVWAAWEQRPLYMAAKYAAEKRAVLDFKGRTYRTTFAVVVPSYSKWRGPGTIHQTGTDQAIRNTCIHLGTWHPGYFDDFPAYELAGTAQPGQTNFQFVNIADAAHFKVGDFVIIRSMAGSGGTNDLFHPEFAQTTQIDAINYSTGQLHVADELMRGGFDVEIHHAESDTINDSPIRHPMRVCAYADIQGISLVNDRFAAFERGGCYRSYFQFPFVKALDLIASNMLQTSTIHIVYGEFNRILNETAGNSLGMNIRVDQAVFRKNEMSRERPIIVTRERCTNCHFDFPLVRADEYDYPNALINIASVGCILRIGDLFAKNASNILVQYQAAGAAPQPAPGRPILVPTCNDNELTIEMAHVGSMNAAVYFNPSIHPDWGVASGQHIYRNHIKRIRVARGGSFSSYAVLLNGNENVIEDFYTESGRLQLGAAAVHCRARGYFAGGLLVQGTSPNDVLIGSASWTKLQNAFAVTQTGQGTTVNSAQAGNSVYTLTVPGDAVQQRDRYYIRVRGALNGALGTKHFRLVRNGAQNVIDLTAAGTGYFSLDIMVSAQFGYPTGRFRFFAETGGEVTWTGQFRGQSPGAVDLAGEDFVLDFQAWVDDPNDSIVIEALDIWPERLFHG